MHSRQLTPVDNTGDGNCVFISLAQIVLKNPSQFEFMRYIIVNWLRNFPQKYKSRKPNLSTYCNTMIISGKPASTLELQVIADIFFAVVECYSTQDFNVPVHVIQPLRLGQMDGCKSRIRLWVSVAHCMALVDWNQE